MRPWTALLRRELLERVRTPSHFIMRTAYVGILLAIVLAFSWEALLVNYDEPISRAPQLGQLLFRSFAFVQYTLVLLLVPLVGAGAISEERAERSLQLLLLTHLTTTQIALGKFIARLGLMVLIILSNVPVLFFAALLGGVEPMDVVRVFSLTTATAAMLMGVALAASAACETTLKASLVTYMGLVLLMLSLFGLVEVSEQWFMPWHAPMALSIAVVEPLNVGSAWWTASLLNIGAGFAAVGVAVWLLGRDVRRTRVRSEAGQTLGFGGGPARVWDNPIAWREWIRRGKPRRWLAINTIVGLILALVMLSVDGRRPEQPFMVGLNIAFFTACIFCLAIGANAFAQEKREQTLDMLRLTYMRPWEILIGKMGAVWRMSGLFVVLALPPALIMGIASDRFPVVAFWIPLAAMVLGMTFVGSVGTFYSLVSSTPMRATMPSVANFLYTSAMLFAWPMIFFQDENAGPIALIIGWGLIFIPPLIFVSRAAPDKVPVGGMLAGVWATIGLCGFLFDEPVVMVFCSNIFFLVNASTIFFAEGGTGAEGVLLLGLCAGTVLVLLSSAFFLWAASVLLESSVDTESVEADDPMRAAGLSLLLPGAGQLYLGHSKRAGIIMAVATMTLCLLGLINLAAAADAWRLATEQRAARRDTVERRRQAARHTPSVEALPQAPMGSTDEESL